VRYQKPPEAFRSASPASSVIVICHKIKKSHDEVVMMLLSVDFMTCSEDSARKKMREPFDRRFYLLPREEESWMSPFEEL